MKVGKAIQICVPICERHFDVMRQTAERAAQVSDLVELRLDCLEANELEIATRELDSWIANLGRPVILTLRPLGQGGTRPLDQNFRLKFFEQRGTADWLDIELDLVKVLALDEDQSVDWSRVICSYHDFEGVPKNLQQIFDEMLATPAQVIKIAVQANDATDCLPLFLLLESAKYQEREMIGIAMGPSGLATRIVGPSRGSFLTYGAMKSDKSTGPGQLTLNQLDDLFHVRDICETTMITGLAGSPVAHSISPQIHNSAFQASAVDAVYIPFEVKDARLFLSRMVHPVTRELEWNFRGLSITAPHKSAVLDQLDWIDEAAGQIGAVNTVVVEQNQLHGYNTDGPALIEPLVKRLGGLAGARCAVIGAGGAARAALWGLQKARVDATLFARDEVKGRAVADSFGASCSKLNESSFHDFDVVINATPLGTRGVRSEETPAVSSQLRGARLAYDLVYNPSETRFLSEARSAGCDTLGGVEMLLAQAQNQFKLWTGIDAPQKVMREAALAALE